ncbi:hypothetical protein [Rhizobium sp. BK176]|uniref:hypothetical protein n=1 Tax=Rhizobium sp. BK176 TaxID=2587071 RepID=UPI0021688F24|nr:hypothetical protein [Rhizobium sp. BK176]MCS4089933.1 hypothetical protein [Rhizobium sp. BK176]
MPRFSIHPDICSTDGWREAIDRIDPEFMPNLELALRRMDFATCFDKDSEEATKVGQKVLSPVIMNQQIENTLVLRGFEKKLTSENYYPETTADSKRLRDIPHKDRKAFLAQEAIPYQEGWIEGDFFKKGLLLEVQFGKYPFVDWDIDKSIQFFRRNRIIGGCVLVPMPSTQSLMSTGPANWQTAQWMFYEKYLDLTLEFPLALIGLEVDLSGPLPKGAKKPKPQKVDNQLCFAC